MVVENRSLGKAPPSVSKITLRASFSGKEVLIDRPERLAAPHAILGKLEVQDRLSSVAKAFLARGEDPAEVETALRAIAGNPRLGLSVISDLLECSARFMDKVDRPLHILSSVARKLSANGASYQRSSFLAFELFNKAAEEGRGKCPEN